MNKFRFTFNLLVALVFTLAFASLAQAQATRTWVSGVGDDVNPCSRTAPCKTFAGAISKTAVNGEIDALDPGGYGVVTVTKGITIDGGGTLASVLATGSGSAILINTVSGGANDQQKVILRRLSLNGTPGINAATSGAGNGVRILQAKNVSVENCYIYQFTGTPGRGISDERTAATSPNALLSVTDTFIENSTQHGIIIKPSSGSSPVRASINRVTSSNNGGAGLSVAGGANCTVANSNFSGNINDAGIEAEGASLLDVESCVSSNNGQGVFVQSGATARLSSLNASQNTTGVLNSGGTVRSFGNNKIDSNTTNITGTFNGPGSGGPTQQ